MPRKKQFDPNVALRQAMELFWEEGYEAASIQDLVEDPHQIPFKEW